MHLEENKYLKKKKINDKVYSFYCLKEAEKIFKFKIQTLPFSFRILLENLIRKKKDSDKNNLDIKNLVEKKNGKEIFFSPSRVLMQDYTGVPAIADLASMRDKMSEKSKDPKVINPIVPVSLVVDHSISVDSSSRENSLFINVEKEFSRNEERYQLLKWAQNSLENFTLFPPGSGICHQINIEFLANIVSKKNNILYLDSVVGTDSHTTMVNALAVLGWGVGGIEAEAVMLGQPISLQIPEVVGVNIHGKMREGLTATDLVLTITEKLRQLNVVGKFVEFFGDGLKSLTLSERSTISNMAPEYGATCGLFPVDDETLKYLEMTGRKKQQIEIIRLYCQHQGLWHDNTSKNINYNNIVDIDLDSIEPCLSGPKRPQDRIKLNKVKQSYLELIKEKGANVSNVAMTNNDLANGKVCIAAVTSCTNTSNPAVMIMAGLVAKKAVEFGIKVPWWVKTSFAPGSKVVEKYLDEADLSKYLNTLGFNIVGFGCTTCIGNSGPLDNSVAESIEKNDLNVCSIISGNRNFEGRIHPLIKSNYLASPPLVIMFAISGKINIDFDNEEITSVNGKKIYFNDLWPSEKEVQEIMNQTLKKKLFEKNYKKIFEGDSSWKKINIDKSPIFNWSLNSTYIKKPPFINKRENEISLIKNARPLLILGDSITTDHISPAGNIKKESEAGRYLSERQVKYKDFNSYGSRRGNHEIMVRGTFANIRIQNLMSNKPGGFTKHYPSNKEGEIYEIAKKYQSENVPLVVVAGKEYGTGSSRDWAAKGTRLLGIKVVIAESFERIHRSNLVGMGVLPLQMKQINLNQLELSGSETFDIGDLDYLCSVPNISSKIKINYSTFSREVDVLTRIDTEKEINYFKNDGILPYVFDEIESQQKL